MLIRFIIKNLFSFKDETEFNLLPGKAIRLKEHKLEKNGLEILKLSALYGANGSGKSNLVKSISLLKEILIKGIVPNSISSQKFKLAQASAKEPIEFAIEFFYNKAIYFYSISINDGMIVDEYFAESETNKKSDKLIFQRKSETGKTSLKFSDGFEERNENKILKNVIEQDLLKANQPLFSLLNSISNNAFASIKEAFNWFEDELNIIYPNSKPTMLAMNIDSQSKLKDFANELMKSFSTGISNLKVDIREAEEFFDEPNLREIEDIKNQLLDNPSIAAGLMANRKGELVNVVLEEGKLLAKSLLFEHQGEKGEMIDFKFSEESDGTQRLLEYVPVLNGVIHEGPTFIIDEIERSIHPLIIKELISKFSKDNATKGQLIFSTHESNLLDQDILRTDEIWFVEKDKFGSSKLYSLNDFREHSTIDIRKGYLNGRYGAIPFLGNLQDLNWNKI